MKSNSPRILEREELDGSERRNEIEIRISPLSLTHPYKPVNENRQSLSARSPKIFSSPVISNFKFASPNTSKSTTNSPRAMIKQEKIERRNTRRVSIGENEKVQAVITSAPIERIKGQENALATPLNHRQNIQIRSSSIIPPSSSQPQPPVRRKTMSSVRGGSIGKQRNIIEKEFDIKNNVLKESEIKADIITEEEETTIGGIDETMV